MVTTEGSQRGARELATLAIATTTALLVLGVAAQRGPLKLDEFALTEGTTSVFAERGGHLIHGQGLEDLPDVLAGHQARGGAPVVLWLGNSQLHAINQFHPGGETAVPIAHRAISAQGLDLIAFSQPNASLQEHYLLFEYLRRRLPVKVLVLPLVFDDTRETGIRPGLTEALTEAATKDSLMQTEVGAAIVASAKEGKLAGGDFAGLDQTLQDAAERSLNRWLDENSDTWRARPQLRGRLLIGLYRLRNTLFGIKPTSKRRIIRSRYAANLAAVEATLDVATHGGIAVVAYLVPLRNDVAPPYVPAEYDRFKLDASALAQRPGVELVDLENLVPAELWGEKQSTAVGAGVELDFMHFQAGGHSLLAGAIVKVVAAKGEGLAP